MNSTWQATADGYFFPQENLSAAVQSKLEMLTAEDAAQISDGGTLIPFEKSFLLSEEDAELLNLPPRNPYQLSIRTEGYIGSKNFKYVAEFLNADGRKVVKSQVKGALLRVDNENIFRLNENQFALINLAKLGNENLSREETYLTVKKIQEHATDSKIDGYISDTNKKIFVPDKLDVDFQESGDAVKVQPILLGKNDKGELKPIDSADFQGAFNNRKNISGVYRGKSIIPTALSALRKWSKFPLMPIRLGE